MQRSQSKILRAIANAPLYVTNHAVHIDFNIPYVSDVIHERINKHHNKPEAHPNALLETLLQPINTFFEELYDTDSIYRVYKDKLQNCSCNKFQ